MDKNVEKKRKTRLNILDILIIFAIVACIAAIGIRVYFTSRAEKTPDSVVISFAVYEISPENAAEFAVGKKVYLLSNNDNVGVIESVNIEPYTDTNAKDENGNVVSASNPDKKTVTGTMTVYGKMIDGEGFMLDGETRIYRRSSIGVYTDRNTFYFQITDINYASE